MAVSVNLESSYRSDFMVSQGSRQNGARMDDGFAKLLDNRSSEQTTSSKPVGSVNSSESISTYEAPEPKAELERVCEVPDREALVVESTNSTEFVEKSDDIAMVEIPEDTMELASKIVSGEISLDEVPLDRLTFELLKAIVVVKKLNSSDDNEDDKLQVFDPAMQFVLQNNVALTLEEQILQKISVILEMSSEELTVSRVEAVVEGMADALPTEVNTAETSEFVPMAEDAQATGEKMVVSEKAEQIAEGVTTNKVENLVETAKADGETDGTVIVRKVEQSEETPMESSQEDSGKESNSFSNQKSPVSKEISEELEMLRNAKLGKTKTDDAVAEVGKTTKSDNAVPVQNENPLADSPLLLRGNNGEMVEVRPSEVISQVDRIVQQVISENREQTEYSMVLNPEALGRITVKLIKAADGAVSVTIVAENASTQRLLEQNSELMQSNLRSNGIQLQSWQTVNEAHQETMQREYDGSSKNPYYREENDKPEEESEEQSFADIIAAM